MEILMLNEEDIREVFTMKDAIDASKEALAYYSEGKSKTPLRVNINVDKYNGDSLYMPGLVEDSEALGVKIVSTYPDNSKKGKNTVPSTMVLLNAEDGIVKSIIDGTYLTRLRTGAVSGAATDILARKNSKVFVMFGTGGQAREQLEAVLSVRPIEKVIIFGGSDKEKTKDFVKQMNKDFKDLYSVEIIAGTDKDEAVSNADIVTTVTPSKTPTFNGKLLKPGTHVNGVGSYREDMVEMDEYTVSDADKLYTDTLEGVINESGDFIKPLEDGNLKKTDITGELGQVIINQVPGRETDEEITVFKTTGTAVLDIVTAEKIYQNAIKRNVGQIINM